MKSFILKIWTALAANRRFYKINKLLIDCGMRGIGILNYKTTHLSGEEHLVSHILPSLGLTKPLCLDVGANVGGYSRMLLDHFPEARIICMEPHPATFAELQSNLKHKAELIPKGAGELPGNLTLYDRSDSEGGGSEHATLYPEVITGIHQQNSHSVQIEITTIDDVLAEKEIAEVDLLKIDTEGHELAVLKGAANLIKSRGVKIIQLEFNVMNLVSRVFVADIVKTLPGYRGYRMLPASLIPLNDDPVYTEIFAFQNLLFIRENLTIG